MSKFAKVYGLDFPVTWTRAQIELACMTNDHSPENGGLGRYGHMRNAMMLLWPGLYFGDVEPGIPKWRDEIDMLVRAWCENKFIAVLGHASAAKCLGKGTLVLMYDGRRVPVEEVKVGDLLMGDDSTPRRVLSTTSGTENLYKIIPSRGDPWVCNESHILSLKASYVPRKIKQFKKGDVRDVPLTEFLTYGQVKRRAWKQYRVGVEFPKKDLPVSPYCYGLWLGDGDTKTPILSQVENAASREWVRYWESRGARIWHSPKGTVPRWAPRFPIKQGRKSPGNPATLFFRTSVDAAGRKRIRQDYLTADRQSRLELLAGIIDTDGTAGHGAFVVTTALPGLAEDVAYLARSLGFGALISAKRTTCQTGAVGKAHIINIAGDCSKIPTRVKKAPARKSNRDPLLQELTVEPLGPGEYFGFEIDGNHRFLLGDFTVTHNTHTFGHIVATEYLADMPNSIVTLTSTHLSGLRKRLWSDTVSAVRTSTAGDLFDIRAHDMLIRPKGTNEEKYCIEGIATDKGQDAVEKIQGTHSRRNRFVVIDEAQGTPPAIFEAAANLMTDPIFKMAMLANPTKKFSELGSWCEPVDGWGAVDPEVDVQWKTKRGGICIRLDGARSTNIVQGRTIFPFLIRQDFVDGIEKSFGKYSPRWWTFYRGWFAPDGTVGIVVPVSSLSRGEKKHVYDLPPKRIASVDPAFEGGDQCILTIAEHDPKFRINLVEQFPIKVAVSETSDPLDKLIATEVIRICKEQGVTSAEDVIVDTTGAGRSVAAFIDVEWGKCQRCNYGGGPTDRRLKKSDSADDTSDKLFDRFVSELWWSVRVFLDEGMIGGIDMQRDRELCADLSAREYETVKDKKISVESKKDMKDRLGRSPDRGDSFAMIIELVRRRGAVVGEAAKAAASDPYKKLRDRAIRYSRMTDVTKEFAHG